MQNKTATLILSTALLLLQSSAHADEQAFHDQVIRDEARGRDLPLRIYHPTQHDGKFPVVIFSHSAGSSKDGYQYFGEYLAAHGIISIQPTHPGTDEAIFNIANRTARKNAVRIAAENPDKWKERVLDIKFLLDSLSKIVPDADDKHVALAGHSFGALTSMMLAGSQTKMPGATTRFGDDRLKAFIAISPYGEGAQFPFKASSTITKPVLVIVGSEDRGLGGQPVAWRIQPYNDLPPGNKYLLIVDGATHMSFADHPRAGSTGDPGKMALAHEYVEKVSVAFLKDVLLHDKSSKAYLDSNGPARESKGAARVDHK